MNQNTFCMAGGVARNPLVRLAKPITATIGANEHIAIVCLLYTSDAADD